MSEKTMLSRRSMLRGLGVAMGLPLLDAMIPAGGLVRAAEAVAGAGKAAAPVRMAMIFMPNGVNYAEYAPEGFGRDYTLSKTLQPLANVKDDLSILSGLTLNNARALGDGPGDHARSAAAFLTGAHPNKTSGKDIKLGISLDQFIAKEIGSRTRMPSLELGLDKSRTVGNCDSGYSCAYVSNISWRNSETPVPNETDPGAVFDRMFGTGDAASREAEAKRLKYRKSVLDFVAEDTKRLDRRLGVSDRHKLDEFTTSVREIEKRIESARAATARNNKPLNPGVARPDGVPSAFSDYMKLMCDMLVLSFRMDVTRISTLMVARDGSDRLYDEIGVTEGHHALSHHGNDQRKVAQIRKIDHFHFQQVAYFLEKLKATKEGNGSLLDNCMVMGGCGISDGNRHNHEELPIFLAGKAGGAFSPGRHIKYDRNTPLCNLYLSMLDVVGVKADRFGDSTGRLTGLNG